MIIVAFIVGMLIGMLIFSKAIKKNLLGSLEIYYNEDTPYMFLEMNNDKWKQLKEGNYICLDVHVHAPRN